MNYNKLFLNVTTFLAIHECLVNNTIGYKFSKNLNSNKYIPGKKCVIVS